jgi:thiol-disulfide isomerase/thioredoxin
MSNHKTASGQQLPETRAWRFWVPRVLAGAVGLLLLIAAVLKATDMELFIRQIRNYDIISHRVVLALGAWGIIALEAALGVALVVFYRPRLILSSTALLFLILAGVTSWGWFTGATEDCGCYGAWLKQTPAQATLENLVLLAAIVLAWLGHRHLDAPHTRAKAWAVTAACFMGLLLPLAFGFPISGITRSQSKPVEVDLGKVQIQGIDHIDVRHGTYLMVLMGTDCPHCQEAVPELNLLAEVTQLDGVIALSTNDESQRLTFIEEFQATFPMGQISDDDFWGLLGNSDIPRFILVRDQHVQQVWDQVVPSIDMIEAALSE